MVVIGQLARVLHALSGYVYGTPSLRRLVAHIASCNLDPMPCTSEVRERACKTRASWPITTMTIRTCVQPGGWSPVDRPRCDRRGRSLIKFWKSPPSVSADSTTWMLGACAMNIDTITAPIHSLEKGLSFYRTDLLAIEEPLAALSERFPALDYDALPRLRSRPHDRISVHRGDYQRR